MDTASAEDLTKTQVIIRMIMEITMNPRIPPLELRRKLGISRDRYYRYFNELSAIIPVAYSRTERRFSITAPVRFPDFLRKPDELYTLLLMVHVLARREGATGSEAMREFARFLGVESEFSHLLKYCVEMGTGAGSTEVRRLLLPLGQAILSGRQIRFSYVDRERKASVVTVEPYRIVHDKDWYLLGNCLERREVRNYKVMRMKEIEILDGRFRMPDEVEVEGIGLPWDFGKGAPRRVRIAFHGPVVTSIVEQKFHRTQEVRPLDGGGLEFAVSVRSPHLMVPWILSYHRGATVLEPESLRRAVLDELDAVRANYR